MIITGKKFSKPEMSRVINGDKKLHETEEKPETVRLDKFLVSKYRSYNRASLQKFIERGFVTVNGELAKKPNQQVLETDTIILTVPESEIVKPKLNILYEDSHCLVVDKPAGLLSMRKGEYCPEATLEDYGLLVHRLDRDTSGVVILAKDPDTQSFLRRQFQARTTHKTYVAVVSGRPRLDSALIDLPIARNLKHPTTFLVDPSGKPSQTNYRVLDSDGTHSLVELRPISGRTHQLRVHMHYLGTPILGDRVYGKDTKSHKESDRLYLHAQSLEITIPNPDDENGPNIRKTFTSPVPPDFTAQINQDR